MTGAPDSRRPSRRASASIFNNDKFAEVVLALREFGQPAVTTQEVARRVSINHDLAKKVMVRLESAGLVKTLPRVGGTRGVLPYEIQFGARWDALVELCSCLHSDGQ